MQNHIQLIEKFLSRLEQCPWNAVYRVFIGLVLLPLYCLRRRDNGSLLTLGLFFLAILFMLRLVPAIVRRLFPFSNEIQALWKQQRELAKRYDSYQWSKLFWIGLGLIAYLVFSRKVRDFSLALALACSVSGGLGKIFWRTRSRSIAAQTLTKPLELSILAYPHDRAFENSRESLSAISIDHHNYDRNLNSKKP